MNKNSLLLIGAMFATGMPVAHSHNTMTEYYAPAGYMQDLELRVTHGCKGSPVKEVRLKIPDGMMRVSAEHNRDWTIEMKMRKLPKPIPGEGGTMLTETVDEIIWKNPRSALPGSGRFEGFRFRGMIPEAVGKIMFFRSVNVCEVGEERYVDLPTQSLEAKTAGLPEKLLKFMTATATPSAFMIIEKPTRAQYPFSIPGQRK
jgi:periplasmic copper chaperone A